MLIPSRGDIWLGHLDAASDPATPCSLVIISEDRYNSSASDSLIVLQTSFNLDEIPTHVSSVFSEAPEKKSVVILCEKIFSIPKENLIECQGKISRETLLEIEDRLRILLGL